MSNADREPVRKSSVRDDTRDSSDRPDLTAALAERDARLRALAKLAPVVMWSTDAGLRYTAIWGSALAALGLEENELVGQTLPEFFGTDDEGFMPIASARRALEGATTLFDIVWSGRSYQVSVEPYLDAGGNIEGTIGVAIDVTDQSPRATELAMMPDDLTATIGNKEIRFTPTEFRLLRELVMNAGRTVSRERLLERVWGYEFLGEGALITMAIKRLREKIEVAPSDPRIIETVRGVGYRFRPPSEP